MPLAFPHVRRTSPSRTNRRFASQTRSFSYLTEPPSEEQIRGLTYATVTPEQRRASRLSWNKWDVIHSGIVLSVITLAYLYFRG